MAFQFSEEYIAQYYRDGYTILREILPPSLIRDLRRVTDAGRAIAREESGPQAQRLQPMERYVEHPCSRAWRAVAHRVHFTLQCRPQGRGLERAASAR